MYRSDIITVEVASGANYGTSGLQAVESGQIVGISVFTNGVSAGIVRIRVTDAGGVELVKSQPIAMLRNRETAFENGYYPLCLQGGKSYKVEIISSANFAADFIADTVFIYGDN